MKLIVLSVFAVALLSVSPIAMAAAEGDQIGTIAAIEGSALVAHGKDATPAAAAVDTPLYLDDVVSTKTGSKVRILFIDDTEVTIGANASFSAEDYMFDEKDPSAGKARYSALRGAFIYVGGLIDKNPKPDVVVAVPYGTIGMRGTIVWGGSKQDPEMLIASAETPPGPLGGSAEKPATSEPVRPTAELPDEAAKDIYGVLVAEGSVTVSTQKGTVMLKAGDGTDINGVVEAPSRPKQWGKERIDSSKARVTLTDGTAADAHVAELKTRNADLRAKFTAAHKKPK